MKKLIFILPILINVFSAKAQFGPQNELTGAAVNVASVYAADMDGDGDNDVLSASPDDNKVAWYENLGGGIFAGQKIISKSTYLPKSVYAIDIDGDGDKDVLAGSQNAVSWYENKGGGLFGNQNVITTAVISCQSVYAKDLDGDGDQDVISASWADNKIAWYENLGSGTFGTQQILTANANQAKCVFAEDLDGDGDVDILSASQGDDIIGMYENLGAGTFGPRQFITTTANGAVSVYSTDMDGDGDKDILASSTYDRNVAWYENLGAGSFSTAQIIVTLNPNSPFEVYATDVDGDAQVDVIIASNSGSSGNEVTWHKNLGGATWGPQQIISTLAETTISIYAEDLDGDGDKDILSGSGYASKVAWHANLGGGFFGAQQSITTAADAVNLVVAMDIDLDGDQDVISSEIGNTGTSKIAWYENFGGGVFDRQKIISTSANPDLILSIYLKDLDNDAYPDILSVSSNSDVAWQRNLGGGSFGPKQIITDIFSVVEPKSVFAVDLNGDGDADVLTASNLDDKIAWYENLGGGTFGPQQIISTSADGAILVIAADLDGDLLTDVISLSVWDNKVAWYKNLGAGSFGPQQILPFNANGVQSIFTVDVDGDLDLDLLSASDNNGHKIAWYENLGGGTFGPLQTISLAISGGKSVYADDIDGDGDADVLSASYGDDKIAWYENLGGGTFGPQQIITLEADRAESVYVADLDGDGDGDVIYASQFDDEVAWFENYHSSAYQIHGDVFYDANQNGIMEISEDGLSFVQVSLSTNYMLSYASNGAYSFLTSPGNYSVNYSIDPLWNLTSDSSSYSPSLTVANPIATNLDFGFYPVSILTIIDPILTGALPRCNDTINYWVNVRNQGTTIPSGIIHLQLDDSITYISSSTPPDSIIGQNIYWNYNNLNYYTEELINLQVQMPPFTSMGDTLTSNLTVHELNGSNAIIYSNSNLLKQVSICAYDPNDKSVIPKGSGPPGYISATQELEYLIRFQNTGNDTAITVTIRDQLDANLDWKSLMPIASSHNMVVSVNQYGRAEFIFENIMLPDSNVDEIASHGFVKFSISPNSNVPPLTPIFNTGHIFFDNNPAVVTNTTLNTTDSIGGNPVSINDISFSESNKLIVFPNPFKNKITVYYKGIIEKAYNILVYDMTGKEIFTQKNVATNKTTIDLAQLTAGFYIISGVDDLGKILFNERIVAQ